MSDAFSTSPETRRSAYNVTSQSQPASTPATSRHSLSSYDSEASSSSREPSSRRQIAADRAAAGAARLHNDLAGGEYEDAATGPAASENAKLGTDMKRSKGRGNHRSHRSRTSGGFLLGDPTFYDSSPLPSHDRVAQGTPSRHGSSREGEKDMKGKGVAHSRTSNSLRSQRSAAGVGHGTIRDSPRRHKMIGGANSQRPGSSGMGGDGAADTPSVQKVLDVDSAKIVNLALNLSESRRQAGMGRRVGSSPMPPAAAGIGMGWEDGYPAGGVGGGVGGSLRQHLQAQRRVSRNMSPKPEHGAGAFASPKLGGVGMQDALERTSSPLMEAFDPDGAYHYEFSKATLDRAEKARNAIELMAQYRRVLLYLPPLKPSAVSRTTTISPPSTSHGSPMGATFSKSPSGIAGGRPLGRQYNPLQYIRNRKVRARERQPINGHTEGFGDVGAVTAWVNRIASAAEAGEYDMSDVLELPPLIPEEPDLELIPSTSSASHELTTFKAGLVPFKPKRPKKDWVINGPDMLADVVWLEQGDNKRLIEDNRERKIFPTRQPLVRMHTDDSSDFERPKREREKGLGTEEQGEGKKRKFAPLKLDTKLPIFNPIRKERSKERKSWGRNKLKLSTSRDFPRAPDGYYAKDKGQISDEGTSGSEMPMFSSLRRRRPRAGTQDSHDLGRDVLEKQMTELLRKETVASGKKGTPERPEVRRILSAMETHSPMPFDLDSASDSGPSKGGSRAASGGRPMRRGSLNLDNGGSTRQSPDVRGTGNRHRPRLSLGTATYYDTTAPNSPEPKAKKMAGFIPNLGMDLSSPPSRRHSQSRKPALQRVRSKISRLRDRSAEPQSKDDSRADGNVEQEERSPEGKCAPRYPPPTKNILRHQKRLTTDYIDSPAVAALIAPKVVESSWKISKSKNPLARVGDLFRNRKDDSCSSDTDDEAGLDSSKEQSDSRRGSGQVDKNGLTIPTHSKPLSRSFLDDMPKFKSPFERGRAPPNKESGPSFNPLSPIISGDRSPGSTGPSKPRNLDDELEKHDRLKPPRIEIDRASNDFSTDPDENSTEDATHHMSLTHRGSQASNLSARSASSGYSNLTRVLSADSHLRHVLGVPPGYPAPEQHLLLPVTGLRRLDHGQRKGSKGSYVEENLPPGERHMVSRREIARVRALLLSAGIKAKEISRRAAEVPQAPDPTDGRRLRLHDAMVPKHDSDILSTVPGAQQFVVAGRLLEQDILTSFQVLGQSVQTYTTSVIPSIYHKIEDLQWRADTSTVSLPPPTMPTNPDPYTTTTSRLGSGHADPSEGLMQRAEVLSNEADELSREVLSRQIMKVKALAEAMDGMVRKRRRRFRWVRRGGWVVVEWALVGVMWWVWLVVVVLRMIRGLGRGVSRGVRWLLWL